ncbi:MAG: BMP family ABC transporter substrate-binding protein [Spirochaetaceae bacterium]|nr:MAG: BMP family ABC transporter substrate-binding protein [Spirochaetaceae bacterium]
MKKIVGLILVVLVPFGCVTAPSPEETQVEELMERFMSGLKEENIDVLMTTYWPEAEMVIKMPDGSVQEFSGIEQIKKVQLGGFQDPNRQVLEFSEPEGDIRGSSAGYRFVVHVPGVRVLNSFELVRRDGKWGIIRQVGEVLPPEQAAGSTPSSEIELPVEEEIRARAAGGGVPRIAMLITRQDLESGLYGEEFMIGVSRSAQELGGTIIGREGIVAFGENIEFTVIPTAYEEGEIDREFPAFELGQYDLVFGCGWMYTNPLINTYRKYPQTHFVLVDSARDVDPGNNLTFLLFKTGDAAFLAGVVAATKVKGSPIGFIGGMDRPFIREEYLAGFSEGLDFADSLQGTTTELFVEFADAFDQREQGYNIALSMYGRGVECIYQVAGYTGFGVLEAAEEVGKWVIGVDTDQGLEFAREPLGRWILTSTVKRWGTAVYLVCKEFLFTGTVPVGVHFVGLNEGCVDIAINPYNTPYLLDQLDLIASVREALKRGEISSAKKREQTGIWKAAAGSVAAVKTSLAVNDPVLSQGIDASYASTLQKALCTAFHESGRFRVISREQKSRLLEEISFSLDVTADEKQQLEVGRLIAAEAIVFVDLSMVGSKYLLDAKVVDVQTGIALSASSASFDAIESVFEGLNLLIRDLSNY